MGRVIQSSDQLLLRRKAKEGFREDSVRRRYDAQYV